MRLTCVIFLTTVYSLCSCTVLFYGDNSEPKKELPTLHPEDYGSIEYIDIVTEEKSRLTKFWAQEAIFAPESRELLQDMGQHGFRFNPSEVGVIDDGFYREGMQTISIEASVLSNCDVCSHGEELPSTYKAHGTHVSNLITGEYPVGVSSKGKITMIKAQKIPSFGFPFLADHKISNPPHVINASLEIVLHSLGTPKYSDEIANELLSKTVFVSVAGNNFPAQAGTNVQELGHKMIIVGSLDPSGFVSDFSQSHENVAVLAPSDDFIMSRGADGAFSKFGGTSGAAPLVSGAVADLRSILPDLNRDEVATIITKTATATSINTVSKHNGSGTLNQYKMLRVGQRMLENGWPHNRANLLANESMYDFTDEAKKLTAEATELLQTTNKDDYQAGFKKLRTAVALDTHNAKARTMLADIYQDAGYSVQAMFYNTPEQSARHASIIKKIVHRTHQLINASYMRIANNFSAWEKLSDIEKKYIKSFGFRTFVPSFNNRKKSKLNDDIQKVMAGQELSPNLARLENYPFHKSLLMCIDTLSSYGIDNKEQVQLLNLLIEYTRDTHPELMADSIIQKAIAKHNLTAVSRIKHRIYNFVHHSMSATDKIVVEKDAKLRQELGNALQEADRHPELLRNDPVIDKYAQKAGVSVADIWKTLRTLAKIAP